MTDRVKGFTVILTDEVRIDDVQPTMDAIKQLRGVASVVPHIHHGEDFIVERRTKLNLAEKLQDFVGKELLE